MKYRLIYLPLVITMITACDFFKQKDSKKVMARVNQHFLYEEDLIDILPENLSREDSIIFVRSYLDDWAMDKILFDKAIFNLPEEEQSRYNRMVKQYKSELFKKAYLNALVKKEINQKIDSLEVLRYYEKNKEIFKINEHLLKIRFIYAKNSLNELPKIKESFKRFEFEDQLYLDSQKLKLDKSKLNDSLWVKAITVNNDLKDLDKQQRNKLLKENAYFEFSDSLGTYFIYVKDVLKPNSIAPVSYIRPTIEQILKNKKEIQLKAELEKQILNDAINNNDYEVFQ